MNKGILGINAFQTAENVCTAIRLYEMGVREMEDIINGVHLMHFIDIEDAAFAQKLFEYLSNYPSMQESIVELFFKEFMAVGNKHMALNTTKNAIQIGEV